MGLVWIDGLNGLSAGLLLFMLSAGLTLIFSVMGVLNFAHAAFYMLGAYTAWTLAGWLGFWPALLLAPVCVGLLGAWVEQGLLRRVHAQGHVAELLLTFGVGQVLSELVQLGWGRSPLPVEVPAALLGPALTGVQQATGSWTWVLGDLAGQCAESGAVCASFPATRALTMGVALVMLGGLAALLRWTRVGLVVRAAQTHPDMVQALGHDLSKVMTGLFALGCALAALAGATAGVTFGTEPSMAASMGSILFVVVVIGGLGSLSGAFWASLLVGALQTWPLGWTSSPAQGLAWLGWALAPSSPLARLLDKPWSQWAPVLPYVLLVLVLTWRPQGLWGARRV